MTIFSLPFRSWVAPSHIWLERPIRVKSKHGVLNHFLKEILRARILGSASPLSDETEALHFWLAACSRRKSEARRFEFCLLRPIKMKYILKTCLFLRPFPLHRHFCVEACSGAGSELLRANLCLPDMLTALVLVAAYHCPHLVYLKVLAITMRSTIGRAL